MTSPASHNLPDQDSWLNRNLYDLDQLADFARGVLSDSNSDGILDTVASPSRTQAWDLDAMGNWQSLATNGTGQSRTHNAQNQVTGVGSASLTFDANGSMTTDETGNTFVYDAWNRLVEAVDGSSVTQAEYAYDALGRRIVETRPVASTTDHLYHSTGWQVLEERRGGTASGDVRHQYLWSIDYVDAMVARVDYASGTVTAKYNVAYDANWNVTAIFDHNNLGAAIRERYAYDPYGAVTILAPNGTVRSSSSYDWKYLHQTGRLDGDTDLYHFRNRDYSATLGRWTQTDPIGFEAGDTNLYRYVGNGPVNGVDPWGLREIPEVGMGIGRGGPKNPGRPGNPNGRPVRTPQYRDRTPDFIRIAEENGLPRHWIDEVIRVAERPISVLGRWDTCQSWVNDFQLLMPPYGKQPGIKDIHMKGFGIPDWIWTPGHAVVVITFKDGREVLVDNGGVPYMAGCGKSGHFSLPGDVPISWQPGKWYPLPNPLPIIRKIGVILPPAPDIDLPPLGSDGWGWIGW